ncbi:TonB-linked outer membrane protein, SusC/RagA family [Filimonas lacunae]|uniref:TonB-linked outer membrane protein, SusC/RagA family n=1 Tax=Filimonas lacunae TaxID=477680 RepID=A0A173MKE3_9BACT|nr:SusC/RagA family TonB-linked outer membrane protein [Filimonas lacunae]BAV07960.1 outer membrane protein, nutrient binding [Filimonas lacunae]SIT07171.1 TonB-linked outer membrane protein, SusC/RagA family [Filimonas lacunae]
MNYRFTGRILFFLWIFLAGTFAMAQQEGQKTYKCLVLDGANLPIPDVAVVLKGSSKVFSSDEKGRVVFQAATGQVVRIGRVGYNTVEITLTDNLQLNVQLTGSAGSGNEVVVTATGIKKEARRLGYATQTVNASQFIKAREPNAVNSLKGNVAGLTVNINPELGHAPDISLRGDGAPMYVVDGVPMTSDTYNINPDDIETFTVLKGPNATALYGFAGQNGAIVITTKKAAKKGVSVDVNSTTQFTGGFLAIPKSQNEYGPGEHGAYAFGNGKGGGINDYDYDGGWGPKLDGRLLPQYDGEYNANENYVTTFKNATPYTGHIKPTPWLARGADNLNRFLQTGLLQSNSVAISTSSDKTDVRFSFGNTYQKGIVPNTSLNNFNFTGNIVQRFSPKVTLNTYVNYNRQSTPNMPDVNYGPNSLIYNLVLWSGADWSVDDMRNYWQAGKTGIQQKFAEYYRYNNPWFMSYEWLRGHYMNNLYGYSTLSYKPNTSFEFLLRPSINAYDFLNTEKVPVSANTYRGENKGDYREDVRRLFQTNIEVQALYHKNNILGFLDVNGLLGANVRSFRFNANYTTTNYLQIPGIYAFSNTRDAIAATSFNSRMKVLSAYYSLDLGYKSYANLNIVGRVDKSSTLPANSNTYFYPSFNLSSVISDYVHLPEFVSMLKVRASYAESKSGGTNTTFTPNITGLPGNEYGYAYLSPYDGPSYTFSKSYTLAPTYNNNNSASYTDKLVNPDIQTAQRKATEFGVDIRFLQNRIGVDITRYHYKNTGIVSQGVSSASGYSTFLTNGNVYTNDGWEVAVNATPVKNVNGFSWNVAANWSTYVKKWVKNANPDNYSYDGTRVDLVYGDAYVRTPQGELVHNSGGTLLRVKDLGVSAKKVFGHYDPDWQWGITNTLTYKNIAFRFQFDGMVGGVMEDFVRKKTLQGGRHLETVQGAFGVARPDDETPAGSYVGEGVVLTGGNITLDPVTGAITNYSSLTKSKNTQATSVQDYVTRMADLPELDMIKKTFSKLREVSISYMIPQSWLSRQHIIQQASVSLVGRNLLYFFPSRYKDLDVDQYTQSNVSGLQTPSTRSYGININVSF